MSSSSTPRHNESTYDLFDRWLAHREWEADAVGGHDEGAHAPDPASVDPLVVPPPGIGFETAGGVDAEDAEVIETEEEFEEFAHPALGGAAGAPSSLGPEVAEEEAAPLPVPTRSSVTAGALAVAHPSHTPGSRARTHQAPHPGPAPRRRPPPGLVLLSPRRGARHILTGVAALLAGGTGIAGYLAWQAPTGTSIGVAAGLAGVQFLVWKLWGTTSVTSITIEHGVLRIAQGHGVHQFPLSCSHPQIDVLDP